MSEQKRRVIFIGSCSYSGSTVLDLVLSSAPGHLSMGDVGRVYLPRNEEHFKVECGCMEGGCEHWSGVVEDGPKGVHFRALSKFGEHTLVDSTKDPSWIRKRTIELASDGVEVINILIWKSPSSIKKSFAKRNIENRWNKAWVNYHRLYFSSVINFYVIPYSSLSEDDESFKNRLGIAGVDYNFQFWEKEHHTLFGNSSAKRHFHDEGSSAYEELQNRRRRAVSEGEDYAHRTVDSAIPEESIDCSPIAHSINDFLLLNDSLDSSGPVSSVPRELRYSRFSSLLRENWNIGKSALPLFRWKLFGK